LIALLLLAYPAQTRRAGNFLLAIDHRAVDVAGSARSVLTTTPIAVGRSSLAVLRSQIIDSSYGTVLNAGSHGFQLQLGGIPDARASDRLFPFDGAEGRLPRCRLLAWCSSNHLDLLLFRLLGFPIAFLLAFCHVDSLEV
jgi:hypothetical protein